jgi:hypothetical protein
MLNDVPFEVDEASAPSISSPPEKKEYRPPRWRIVSKIFAVPD